MNVLSRVRSRSTLADEWLTQANFRFPIKGERMRSVLELETLFFDLVQRSGAEVFLEAGAKDAKASRHVAEHQPGKNVVALEANPFTFKRFNKRFNYKEIGVDYRHIAVSDFEGTIAINVRMAPGGTPRADGRASILDNNNYKLGHQPEDVTCSTIDKIIGAFPGKNYCLWMDVEGALEPVLNGALPSLNRLQVAFIEVEHKEYWEKQWLKRDVDNFFQGAGFVPLARDYQSTSQCNVIYIAEHFAYTKSAQQALREYKQRVRMANGRPVSAPGYLKNLLVQRRTFKRARKVLKGLVALLTFKQKFLQ